MGGCRVLWALCRVSAMRVVREMNEVLEGGLVDKDLLHAKATGTGCVGHYHNGSERQQPTRIGQGYESTGAKCAAAPDLMTGTRKPGILRPHYGEVEV